VLPVSLSRAVALPGTAGHVLVLSGLHDGERSTDAVLDLDPAGGTATVLARLPLAVHDAAGALLAGVPTVFGGGAGHEVAAVQQYQPTAKKALTVGRVPTPVSDPVAVTTERGVLLIGGYDGTRTLDQVLLVTDRAHAQVIGHLPTPVRYAAAVVVGSGAAQRVLVFGGESGGIATDAVQEIDPATGKVTVVTHLPAPRTQASALVLWGTVFLFGGASSGTTGAKIFDDVLRYDPTSRAFTPAGRLPYPVSDAATVSPDGRTGYLIGGETPARTAKTIIITAP
jgi:N-acetylneuraminic acid mutarotase